MNKNYLFAIKLFHLAPTTLIHIPRTNKRLLLQSVLLSLLGGWATTILPSFIVPYFALSLPAIIILLYSHKNWKQVIIPLFLSAIGIAFAAFVLKIEFSKGSPWTEWTAEEKSWMRHGTVVSQYLQALLYYYPFILASVIGSLVRYKKMSSKLWCAFSLSLFWLFGPIPLIYISHLSWFPFANFRLVDLHGYAPAAILSTIGLWHILSVVTHQKLQKITVIIISITILAISGITTWQYTKQILASQEQYWTNIYPSKLTWQGVLFMDKLPLKSNVMVREFFGEMLPAFGPVSVFIGGGHGFRDWGERQWISQHFYKGLLSDTDALDLLRKENITHVFWGPDEKALLQTNNFYSNILVPIFSNSDVTIFSIKY